MSEAGNSNPPTAESASPTPLEEFKKTVRDYISLQAVRTPKAVIEGVIEQGSLVLLYAPSNSYKSFICYDMLAKLSRGEDWFEHKTETKGYEDITGEPIVGYNCLYLCVEGGDFGLSKRHLAWMKSHNKIPRTLFRTEKFDFGRPHHTQGIKAFIESQKIDVIAFDTVAICTPGLEENSNPEVNQFFNIVDDIRSVRPELVTILVHHASFKTEDDNPRGATAWIDRVDTAISIKKDGLLATLHSRKERNLAPFKSFTVEFRKVTDLKNAIGEDKGDSIVPYLHIPTLSIKTQPSKNLSSWG